jgi:DNA invertase Pin-like site-specific DNA recombinase
VLVVWRLDRLGRSLRHLIELLHGLAARGVQFRSLSKHLDTTTPTGKLTFYVIRALAEFERAIIYHRAHQRRTEGGEGARRAARPQAVIDADTGQARAQADRGR